MIQGNLDVRDAAVNTLLQEVASLLQLLVKQGGKPLIQHLASTTVPQLKMSADLQARIAWAGLSFFFHISEELANI